MLFRSVCFRDNSLPSDMCAIKICPFPSADQVCASLYLYLDLAACNRDAASVSPPADAKTSTDIPDVHGADLHLQLAGGVGFDIKISIASQHLNPGGLGISDGDAAIRVQTDIDVRARSYRQAFPLDGLVNPRCRGFGDEP